VNIRQYSLKFREEYSIFAEMYGRIFEIGYLLKTNIHPNYSSRRWWLDTLDLDHPYHNGDQYQARLQYCSTMDRDPDPDPGSHPWPWPHRPRQAQLRSEVDPLDWLPRPTTHPLTPTNDIEQSSALIQQLILNLII
jgi:hypothetical protein